MNTQRIILGLFATILSGSVLAGHERYSDNFLDVATVTRVEPIVRVVRITTPQRECYQQEVRTPVHQGGRNNEGAAVVGGVVGGILGHKMSKGKGGATVAGTLIGAAIGNEIGKANATPPSYHEEISYVDRCDVREVSHDEERVDGYHVTYRYHGETFTTRLPYDPGKQLRIRVNVTPVN